MAGVCKGAISATEAYFMDDTRLVGNRMIVHCNLRDLRKAWRVCNTNCMPISVAVLGNKKHKKIIIFLYSTQKINCNQSDTDRSTLKLTEMRD